MDNRIRELRTARGWSYAEVAKRVADNTSPSTIQKLEQGAMQLTPKWAEALARVFEINSLEIYGTPGPRLASIIRPAAQMAEDVVPYTAETGAETAPPTRPGLARYMVTSHALDELGLLPGMIVEVNETPAATRAIATGDIVIATIEPVGAAHATTVMREFVEPALLITNSRDENERPVNTRTTPTRVVGVVETVFRSLRRQR